MKLSRSTLQKHRCKGTGPEYLKIGRSVRYRMSAVLRWAEGSQVISSASQGRA